MNITESIISYTIAATALTLTPGLDTVLILRTASSEGKKQAFQSAMGINTGCLVWGAAVALGLAALLAVSEIAYTSLKIVGACYLAWLGINFILKPRTTIDSVSTQTRKKQNWFVKGMLGNILNPKIGIFYVSFLPQFIPIGHNLALWTMILVMIHVLLLTVWSSVLILTTTKISGSLKKPNFIKWMDRCTGAIFVAFATKLAFSSK